MCAPVNNASSMKATTAKMKEESTTQLRNKKRYLNTLRRHERSRDISYNSGADSKTDTSFEAYIYIYIYICVCLFWN